MSDNEEIIVENSTDMKETIKEIENDIIESAELSGEEGVSTKNIQKVKKPRTEAQKAALRKAQEARKLKAIKKKQLDKDYMEDSEYFKRLTPQQRKVLKEMAIEKPKEVPHKKSSREKVVYEDDPSSDEEIVVIKKKKPKKKKKQKVIYESESDSSEEEAIVKQIQKPKKKKEVKIQQAEEEFSDEEPYYYQHSNPPLTYGSIARFL